MIAEVLLLGALLALAPALDDVRFSGWGRRELALLEARPYYLLRERLLAIPVPPPPRNGSATTRAELDEMLLLQGSRSGADERAIQRHRSHAGVVSALLDVMKRGPSPRTKALLEHVDADLTVAVFHGKRRFERARPHQLEPRLRPLIPVPAHAAYPSGHAAQGHLSARVLGAACPEHRAALRAQGERLGREREIAGLHYPSDSAAGRALAEQVFLALDADERFRRDLAAARLELGCKAP